MRVTRTWGLAVAAVSTLAMGGFLALRSPGPPGPVGPPARSLAELIDALTDPVPELRREAGAALARLGPQAAPALKALLAALDDEDVLARAEAVVALGRLGPAAV